MLIKSENSHDLEISSKAGEGGTLQTARMAAGISPQARAHFDNAIVKHFSYFFLAGAVFRNFSLSCTPFEPTPFSSSVSQLNAYGMGWVTNC